MRLVRPAAPGEQLGTEWKIEGGSHETNTAAYTRAAPRALRLRGGKRARAVRGGDARSDRDALATPAPTPVPTPTPLALPREGAYTFSCPELGLSFPVSEELAPLLIIRPGVHFFDEGGDSISLFLGIPDGNEAEAGSLARVPRREHFDPTRYYRRYMTAIRVVAASDESLYVDVGTIGGVSGLRNEDIDRYEAAARRLTATFSPENLTVEGRDSLPVLTPEAVSAEIVALESAPAETMTRAEGAVWAFDLLAADNKIKNTL